MDRVGGNPAQIFNFRYCCASRMGRPDLALEILRESVIGRGYWYSYDQLLSDDDLAPLRGIDEFQSLARICKDREEKAVAASKSRLRILSRTGGSNPGVLIALHGNGENADIAKEFWSPARGIGYDVALVQSSETTFSDGYYWNDLERGMGDLCHQLTVLKRTYDLGTNVVLGGFSAGARLSLLAILKGALRPRKIILVGPWLPEIEQWIEDILRLGDREGFECDIVCGTNDQDCFAHAKRLTELLDEAGVRHSLRLVDGMAHDFPDDFNDYLVRLLNK